MTSGVYKLTFGNDEIYIGRSTNIEQRYKAHLSDMRLGKSSKKILAAYRKHGAPLLYILCIESDLDKQKQLEIDFIKENNSINCGLNTTLGGEDVMYGELNTGSKYSNIQIYQVLQLLANNIDLTLQEISDKTEISISVVKDISAGTRHTWLASEYPEEYSKMISNKEYRHTRSLANLTDKHRFKSTFEVYPKLISPNGLLVEISGSLSKFAKEHGLQLGNLSSLLHNKRKSHKGWKLAKGA